MERFPFNKKSGLKFRKFYVFKGTVHSVGTDPTQATVKYKHNKRQNKKWPTLVVYHLLGKTGWSAVVVNGTRQIPIGNFHLQDCSRTIVNYRASLELVGIQDGGGNAAVVRNA